MINNFVNSNTKQRDIIMYVISIALVEKDVDHSEQNEWSREVKNTHLKERNVKDVLAQYDKTISSLENVNTCCFVIDIPMKNVFYAVDGNVTIGSYPILAALLRRSSNRVAYNNHVAVHIHCTYQSTHI